ncbi:MAG: hypothetical protein ACI3X8_03030 [Alloprevotella sp.]
MKTTLTTIFLFVLCCNLSKAGTWTDLGNYSLAWYTNSSSDQRFTISSEKEIAALAYLVNNGYTDFSNKTITLENDLDLSAHTWIGIGKNGYSFKGTFLGQGHRIEGVRLTEESGAYPYYGFWLSITNAEIKDLTIAGTAVLNFFDAAYPNTTLGMFAATAYSCRFENCNSIVDISYYRSITYNFGYSIKIGGMIGEMSKTTMAYCNHKGNIIVEFGRSGRDSEFYDRSSSIIVGGLVASDVSSSVIKYCGNYSEHIKVDAAGSVNTNGIPTSLGGIIGSANSNTQLTSCFNNSKHFEAIFRGNSTASIKIGGIAGFANYYSGSSGGIYNCYSSTSIFHVTVQTYSSNVYCGGVVAFYNSSATNKYKACFGPADLTIYSPTTFNLIDGYSGSNAYTENQMKTDDFLSELNLYLQLTNDKSNIWVNDKEFPYIKRNDASSLAIPTKENQHLDFTVADGCLNLEMPADVRIYSMEGKLEFSGITQQTCRLAQGTHILKVGGESCIFYVK